MEPIISEKGFVFINETIGQYDRYSSNSKFDINLHTITLNVIFTPTDTEVVQFKIFISTKYEYNHSIQVNGFDGHPCKDT